MKSVIIFVLTALIICTTLSASSLPAIKAEFPVNNAININTGILRWSAIEGAVTYDLYLGTSSNPMLYKQGLTSVEEKPVVFGFSRKYFWQVFAITAERDTIKSDLFSFTTLPVQLMPDLKYESYVDLRDYKIYWSVDIGSKQWMISSLDYDLQDHSWYYDNSEENKIYGRIYDGSFLIDNSTLAPSGWHIPSLEEWEALLSAVGGIKDAGIYLKESSDLYWRKSNYSRTNSSGFSILPSGSRDGSGKFSNGGKYVFFWTTTPDQKIVGNFRKVDFGFMRNNAILTTAETNYGYSVRCVKD